MVEIHLNATLCEADGTFSALERALEDRFDTTAVVLGMDVQYEQYFIDEYEPFNHLQVKAFIHDWFDWG